MSELTQDQRLISISTPLGKDELLLTSFEGTEHISDLFEFQIEVLSKNHKITPDQLIGKLATITIQNDKNRTFNGYISSFTYGEVKADNLRTYHLTMVPWLWFLSKTNNHRIFQDKTTTDIVSTIFKDLGFNDFNMKAVGNATPREYCVQHNESDLNFISRLLEEEGIAYYFEQADKKHIMHIVDAANAYQECVETNLTYSKGNQPDTQITRWEHGYEFRKGNWSLNDYDYKTPPKNQLKTTPSTSKFANAKDYTHYEYTPYHDFAGIQDLTKKRMQAEEVPMNVVEASSDCSTFYAGGKFKVKKHAVSSELGSYIITSIHHRAQDNSYLAGHESQSEYANDFSCIPDTVHFRPPLVHVKPVMRGPQSAVVVDYLDPEDNARIKIAFHWDKEKKHNSCFAPVMQPWAGAGWGSFVIPRVGMEVVVNFYEGDSDRPIITGCVYNWENKHPFETKTQSGVKTDTVDGDGCNILRFDDVSGSEQIFVHAEHNLDTEVENDETHSIDHNRTKTIGDNETSSIGKNRDKSVGENQTEAIGKNKTIDVGDNHSETIGKNQTQSIGKDKSITVGDNHTESIGKDMSIQVGKNLTEDIGKNLAIVAGDQIVLKTGSASITMKKNGDITIKGKNITLQGSGKIDVKASSAVTVKGSAVKIN